jgi:hypothetical protein
MIAKAAAEVNADGKGARTLPQVIRTPRDELTGRKFAPQVQSS